MNSNFKTCNRHSTIYICGMPIFLRFCLKEANISLITVSDVTGEKYEPEDSVYFKNAKQSASYVLWGAKLLDVFPTSDKVFVFVFSKSDHDKYKVRWNNHEE